MMKSVRTIGAGILLLALTVVCTGQEIQEETRGTDLVSLEHVSSDMRIGILAVGSILIGGLIVLLNALRKMADRDAGL